METAAGLWLDHRKTLLVLVSANGEEMKLIIAKVERQGRRSSSSPIKGQGTQRRQGRNTAADDIRQRKYTNGLAMYYDAVIGGIGDATALYIFGPGEAKGELRERLQKKGLAHKIVGFETEDKMTDRQIVAKVRQHFGKMDGAGTCAL